MNFVCIYIFIYIIFLPSKYSCQNVTSKVIILNNIASVYKPMAIIIYVQYCRLCLNILELYML